jgi:dihydroorotate dehydrogenase
MYNLVKKFLFRIEPEKAKYLTFFLLKLFFLIPGIKKIVRNRYLVEDPIELFGLKFKNRVGLAAGFDKNATIYKQLSNFGFGFIEIGTVTPLRQEGKNKIFRIISNNSLVNKVRFTNNDGVFNVSSRLKSNRDFIVGANISRGKKTSNILLDVDYITCFEELYKYVDYFTINIENKQKENLRILKALQKKNNLKPKRKPILIKISPDLTENNLLNIIKLTKKTKIDGIIATNTTTIKDDLVEVVGLSGKPIKNRSLEVVSFLHKNTNGEIPIIGVGGIDCEQDAVDMINAGASLVQIWTGFVYKGPSLVRSISNTLKNIK